MLIAVPTINNKLISRRFGRLTEISFLEIEENKIIRQFSKPVSPHGHDEEHEHGHHHHHNHDHHHGDHNQKHDEILEKLSEADVIIIKSLCRNWRERLSAKNARIKSTDGETLEEIIQQLTNELAEE